jgi:membrane protein required for colicin V production
MVWVDIVLFVVLALSIVVGLFRGLVFELMSLVGWVVAYVVANWLSPLAAPYVPVGQSGSSLNHAAALLAVFVLALLVWSVLSRLVRLLIHATPLSWIDRILGAFFGGARGVLALLVLATVVGLTPLVKSPNWQASRVAPLLKRALHELKPVLPAQLSQRLPA